MTDELMNQLERQGLVAPDGAELLDEVADVFGRYVAFPSPECRDTVTLWSVHTHCLDSFENTPRLVLLSPEPQSGKTRTLELLDMLTPKPMHAANLSAAALFRQVAAKRPTLLMDEADTYLGLRTADRHEELRGLVNAGHRRGAVAYRCVGEPAKMEVKEFPAFAAVALAGIGDIPTTILDRSVLIRMRRRAPSERIEPLRERKVRPKLEALRTRIAAWAEANAALLAEAEPEMPPGIVDRPADVWEPLIAVADLAGGDWPARARIAAVEITAARAAAEPSLGIQLLTDARAVFDAEGADRLSSEEFVRRLCGLEEAPWGDLRGKAIDARGVARRLRPFGIRPHVIRIGSETPRGYERSDFHDAWARYLPLLLSEEGATSATDATPQVTGSLHVADTKDVADTSATRNGSATDSRPPTCTDADVADVAVSEPSKRGSTDDPLATIRATFPNATPASDDELSLAAEQHFADEWNDYIYERARMRRASGA